MPVYILSRLVSVIGVVLAVAIITFLTLHLLRPEAWAFDQRLLPVQLWDYLSHLVRLDFGRVKDGRGVVSASGDALDADIRFILSSHPADGGFCRHCGAELEVAVVSVITPPDGGVIGTPQTRCGACGKD